MRKFASVCLMLLALAFAGCSASVDPQRNNDMKSLGLAYHNFQAETGKGPSRPEDLAKDVHDPRVVELLKSGEIVFIWNVRLVEMTAGAANTILAYEKKVPDKGGLALYGDGSVRQVSADEFKKATLAKPKGQ